MLNSYEDTYLDIIKLTVIKLTKLSMTMNVLYS